MPTCDGEGREERGKKGKETGKTGKEGEDRGGVGLFGKSVIFAITNCIIV